MGAAHLRRMTANGKKRPRRPTIEVVAPAASPEQAAAIAAALERFLQDTAPAPARRAAARSPWERAALAEGVCLPGPGPWGDPVSWGS